MECCKFPDGGIPEVRLLNTLTGVQLESLIRRLPSCVAKLSIMIATLIRYSEAGDGLWDSWS